MIMIKTFVVPFSISDFVLEIMLFVLLCHHKVLNVSAKIFADVF